MKNFLNLIDLIDKYNNKKIIKLILTIFLIFIIQTKIARAFGIGDVLSGVVGWIIFLISYIISIIGGVIIAFESFLIEIVLQLNQQIIQSQFVQAGFLISLSITNLIFVSGIIIIAISTILGIKNYRIKDILWKLILMAILVNFSLTISGAIIKISDNLSSYFLDAIDPEVGPGGQKTSSKYGAFATAIAGAFSPQRLFLNKNGLSTSSIPEKPEDLPGIALASSLSGIIKPIISIFFVIIFLIQIIIVMGTIFVMFIQRYISLSFLLILAPLAWAMWVFPKQQKYWTEWWDNFLKWIYFGPIVLLFLYLCILTLKITAGGSGDSYSLGGISFIFDSGRRDALGALQNFVGTFLGDLGKTIIEMIMMIGCVTGSLIAADKIGIKGADATISTAKGVSGKVNSAAANWFKKGAVSTGTRIGQRTSGYFASTLTEPPPQYTGWRKVFNPLNRLTYKVGGAFRGKISEETVEKIQQTARKYGPLTREQERQEKRRKVEKLKSTLKNTKEERKEVARQVAEKQRQLNDLLSLLKEKEILIEETVKESEKLEKLKKQLEEIEKQLSQTNDEKRKAKLTKLRDKLQKRIKEKSEEISLMEKDAYYSAEHLQSQISQIKTELKTYIEQKRSFEEIEKQLEELKPSLLYSAIKPITSFTETSIKAGYERLKNKKQKKKIKKSQLKDSGFNEEEIKELGEILGIEVDIEKESNQKQQ